MSDGSALGLEIGSVLLGLAVLVFAFFYMALSTLIKDTGDVG